MNTKILLAASAFLLGGLGLAASFFPEEILTMLGEPMAGTGPLLVQLLGALYLGFGMLNWMSKGVVMGGIYARPLVMGNLLHFFAGAMALLKQTQAGTPEAFWGLAVIYVLLAVLFGVTMFRHPLKEKASV